MNIIGRYTLYDLEGHFARFMTEMCKADDEVFNAEEVGNITHAVALFMAFIDKEITDYECRMESMK